MVSVIGVVLFQLPRTATVWWRVTSLVVGSEPLELPDRSGTFEGLVDFQVRGMPPVPAMTKGGLAVAADPAIDYRPQANRTWDGVMPIPDLLVGSPGFRLGHGLLPQLHPLLGDGGDLLWSAFLPDVFTT